MPVSDGDSGDSYVLRLRGGLGRKGDVEIAVVEEWSWWREGEGGEWHTNVEMCAMMRSSLESWDLFVSSTARQLQSTL